MIRIDKMRNVVRTARGGGGRGGKTGATCIQCIVMHSWKSVAHFVFYCLVRDLFAFVWQRENWMHGCFSIFFTSFIEFESHTCIGISIYWTEALGMGEKYRIQQNRLTEYVNGFHDWRFEIVVSTCSDLISRWKCLDTWPYRIYATDIANSLGAKWSDSGEWWQQFWLHAGSKIIRVGCESVIRHSTFIMSSHVCVANHCLANATIFRQ